VAILFSVAYESIQRKGVGESSDTVSSQVKKYREPHLKGQLKKKEGSHHLFTLMLFLTCITLLYFLLSNTKDDILKNVGNQAVLVNIDYHYMDKKKTLFFFFFQNMFFHVPQKKVIQVWNSVSK